MDVHKYICMSIHVFSFDLFTAILMFQGKCLEVIIIETYFLFSG